MDQRCSSRGHEQLPDGDGDPVGPERAAAQRDAAREEGGDDLEVVSGRGHHVVVADANSDVARGSEGRRALAGGKG